MAFKWTISDDYPRTLHQMASLIGAKNSAAPKSGLEKRIELDILPINANNNSAFEIAANDLINVLESIDCHIVDTLVEEDITFFICDHCLVVVAPTKIIFTADSAILIHKTLTHWMNLLKTKEYRVEWSSFMRKNTTAPWSAHDAILAEEYTELKAAFPNGNAFLFGPLDADHYFYYIFDGVERLGASAVSENTRAMDLQINVALHDVEQVPVIEALGLRKTNKSGTVYQRCMAIAPGKYQTVRMLQDEQKSNTCVVESNADSIPLATLVEQFCPSRFSVTYLVDPNCPKGETFDASALTFESYRKDVQMTNEFTGGYHVSKATFTRE